MPTDDPIWLKSVVFKVDHLEKWLAGAKKVAEVAPIVQKNLDYTRWIIKTVRDRPEDMPPLPDLTEDTERDLSYVQKVLPTLQAIMQPAIMSSTSVGSSIVGYVFDYTQEAPRFCGSTAVDYAKEAKASLEKLNSQYQTVDELRARIRKLGKSGLDDRFEIARESFESYRVGTTDRMAAAGTIRTFIDGVRGELFERARKQPGEDMTWERMAKRLAPESPQYETVFNAGPTLSKLIGPLSDILKDREGNNKTDLEVVWLEMLSNMIAVMGSITI
jgi:hypothetical protein